MDSFFPIKQQHELIIHFGQKKALALVDHKIPKKLWETKMDEIMNHKKWPTQIIHQKHTMYSYDSLQYDISEQKNCYTISIKKMDHILLNDIDTHFSGALVSLRYRQTIDENEFLPINKYYNIHDVYHSIFEDLDHNIKIVFEKKVNHSNEYSYEIYLIYNGDSPDILQTYMLLF